MRTGTRCTLTLLLLACAFLPPSHAGAQAGGTIALTVDATEAPRKIFHARLEVPVSSGPLVLLYPKWIPGEHGPTGPVTDLAGLSLTAAGRPVPWQRDSVDMYAFHCLVPEGATSLEVALDFLSPAATDGFSSGASTTAELCDLSWNQLLLYPQGPPADRLVYRASLRLPAGWKFGTALPVARESAEGIEFEPVPLSRLVDSPVIAGANFKSYDLTPGGPVEHRLDVVADSRAALDMPADYEAAHRRLVAEAQALFGARHYRRYHFLLSLSEGVSHFGLEHHESSDDRAPERMLVDAGPRRAWSGLLPHEFVHSWNGKYRRPADLIIPDYSQPMRTELLWVYEGLTEYLGFVLAARSGMVSPADARDELARVADVQDHRPGRRWRPLLDTAVAAQLLYNASAAWTSWRRGVDFYDEGLLIWLEADGVIRRESHGRKSLDDFCRLFFGGATGGPEVVPYTEDDVLAALGQVQPYDWRGFMEMRIARTSEHAPLGGIVGAGWRLGYADTLSDYLKDFEDDAKSVSLRGSIGLVLKKEGEVTDVVLDSPAAAAGLGPGMKIVAVNGRQFAPEVLRAALKATREGEALELLVRNGEFYASRRLDYRGGERYPSLERITGAPDLLSRILAPKTAAAAAGRRAGHPQ